MASPGDAERRVVVLGVGNILLKDEGVGVRVVEELRYGGALPPGVVVVDGGTAGLHLLDAMENANHVVVVDGILADAEPGTMFRVELDDLVRPASVPRSLHEVGVLEVLGVLATMGRRPHSVLIGVQPGEISLGLELSPPVAARVPDLVAAVRRELQRIEG